MRDLEALASQQGAIDCGSGLHRACLYLKDEARQQVMADAQGRICLPLPMVSGGVEFCAEQM